MGSRRELPLAAPRGSLRAMVIDRASARALAERWVAAWNSGDLEQVFALYHDDFEMRSPLIVERGCACHGADA